MFCRTGKFPSRIWFTRPCICVAVAHLAARGVAHPGPSAASVSVTMSPAALKVQVVVPRSLETLRVSLPSALIVQVVRIACGSVRRVVLFQESYRISVRGQNSINEYHLCRVGFDKTLTTDKIWMLG
jgi:hypothetical protein